MKYTIAALVLAVAACGLPADRSSDPSSTLGVQEGSEDATRDLGQDTDFSSESREVDAAEGRRNLQARYRPYVLPPWWGRVNMVLSPVNLKRCYRRQFPPDDGASCSTKAKTCFFGTKLCPGGFQWPEIQCYCNGDGATRGNWNCTDVGCPPPTQDDEPSSAPSISMLPSASPSISMLPSTTPTELCLNVNIDSFCPWSSWFNFDDAPPPGSDWAPCGGTETPLAIECEARETTLHSDPVTIDLLTVLPAPAADTGELIGCGRCFGAFCDDSAQPHGRCEYQYQYRVKCPCSSDDGAPTPSPGPTFGRVFQDVQDNDGSEGNTIDVGPLPTRVPTPTRRPTPFPTRSPTIQVTFPPN